MGIIVTVAIGFAAGIIAKFVISGYKQTPGFDLTTTLGVLGAVIASFPGLILGWFSPGEGDGMLVAAIGGP